MPKIPEFTPHELEQTNLEEFFKDAKKRKDPYSSKEQELLKNYIDQMIALKKDLGIKSFDELNSPDFTKEKGLKELTTIRDLLRKLDAIMGKIKDAMTEHEFDIIEVYEIPKRSKRGPRFKKSKDNPHAVEKPSTEYLMPEVEITPPEKAVAMLKEMFPGLDTSHWQEALRKSIKPAIDACKEYGLDPERLIFFPWIKREALENEGGMASGTHYGKLIEQVIFPKLKELYKQQGKVFDNLLKGKMGEDRHMQMDDKFRDWLEKREEEVDGDICFTAVLIDPFKGFSADATRKEIENKPDLIPASSLIVQQMLLTKIDLLKDNKHQTFDMPGDKYDCEGKFSFASAPCCFVYAYGFEFDYKYSDFADSGYGSLVFPSRADLDH